MKIPFGYCCNLHTLLTIGGWCSTTCCMYLLQVLLINAVKDVASALGDLISATKYASGKSQQDPAMTTLRDSAKVGSTSPATVGRQTSSLNVGHPVLMVECHVLF